jgi:MFS family permease
MNSAVLVPPVWIFCITQVISWGTLYYAFSVLLAPIGAGRAWNQAEMAGAFSVSLLVSGLAAYPVGKLIHRFGGRLAMSVGSACGALSLAAVSAAPSLPLFYLAWGCAGLAMSLTLYEAAFAVLATIDNVDYRRAVTAVTLAGGFASTLFWPLTEGLVRWTGWQSTLLLYAALHLFVCLPLHAAGLPAATASFRPPAVAAPAHTVLGLIRMPRFLFLAASFTLNSIVFAVFAVHLIPILESKGLASHQAAWLAAFAGPMQVLGRVLEFRLGGRWRPSHLGIAALTAVIPALLGLATGHTPWFAILLCIGLYGIGNGVMTIVRSLSVADLFGRQHYAQVSGAISAPSTLARAAGPILASAILAFSQAYAAVLMLLALFAVLSLLLFWHATHATPNRTGDE